jgi:carbon starvation protein
MAKILSDVIGGKGMMGFWYHFAILFEALFILTTLDAGTRVCRFMIQDFLGTFYKPMAHTGSWTANLVATTLAVSAWGYFLYQGVIDPLGGINTLWPLFGIANQMLAGIALILVTTVLVKMKKERFVWVTLIPTLWLLTITLTAGWRKLFDADPKIGFLSHARKFADAAALGNVLPPAKGMAQMRQIIMNDYVDATFCALFMIVVATMVFMGLRAAMKALAMPSATTRETPMQLREEAARA